MKDFLSSRELNQSVNLSPIRLGVNWLKSSKLMSGQRISFSSWSVHLSIMCMLELCMLFHGLGPSPQRILSTSFMLPSRNPLLLNPLNCGGQPFLHAMWQNTRTGMGRTFVHLSIEMYVMNRLSTASLGLASSGDKLFLSVKVKGRTSFHAAHALIMCRGSCWGGEQVSSFITIFRQFTKILVAGSCL